MVICDESALEIDLKCKEKVTDSDSESHSDMEHSNADKNFLQQRFSPTSNVAANSPDVTCRPKPIKAQATDNLTPKYSPLPTNKQYSSPVNPTGVSGFQPTGGAFASPKVFKNELKSESEASNNNWAGGLLVVNNNKPTSLLSPLLPKHETLWTNANTVVTSKPATTLAILNSQQQSQINKFQIAQPVRLTFLNSSRGGQSTTLCLTSDSGDRTTHPVVGSSCFIGVRVLRLHATELVSSAN